MKIGIIGTGAFGISLAFMFRQNNCDVTMWTRFKEEKNYLEKNLESPKLKDFKIPKEIKFTNDLEKVSKDKDIIVIALPAAYVSDVAKDLKKYYNDQYICIASKGIERDSCLFVTDIFSKYIKTNRLAVISGPSFATDIVKKVPIGLALASKDKKTIEVIKKALENKYLKLRATKDVIGIEICGSIKNVIAIASGMINGMNLSESTQAMFITESLHDIKQLIKALGGDKKTILSYAGFGDLLLTCTSTKSRNYKYGQLIGSKKSYLEIDEYIHKTTIEGLYTLSSIHKLIKKKKVDIPIIDLIYDIVFNEKEVTSLLEFLIVKE